MTQVQGGCHFAFKTRPQQQLLVSHLAPPLPLEDLQSWHQQFSVPGECQLETFSFKVIQCIFFILYRSKKQSVSQAAGLKRISSTISLIRFRWLLIRSLCRIWIGLTAQNTEKTNATPSFKIMPLKVRNR